MDKLTKIMSTCIHSRMLFGCLRLFLLLLAISLSPLFGSTISQAQDRIALVVGNADYGAMGSLKNPINDSRLMASVLRSFDFHVIEVENANLKKMRRAVRDFGRLLRRADDGSTALFYYAGHGVQVGGQNFILPVEAVVEGEGDVAIESVSVNDILAQIKHANTGVNIVILDACRNNPFQQGFRSLNNGLARMDAPTGTYIAYATAPGQLAVDGDGANSPFTRYLAETLMEPSLPVEILFKRVRQKVALSTKQKQIPWSSSSLIGDFVFNNKESESSYENMNGQDKVGHFQIELEYWNSIKDSNSQEDYIKHIRDFPKGVFSDLARRRVSEIEEKLKIQEIEKSQIKFGSNIEVMKDNCIKKLRKPGEDKIVACLEVTYAGKYDLFSECGTGSPYDGIGSQGNIVTRYLDKGEILEIDEIEYAAGSQSCYRIGGGKGGNQGYFINLGGLSGISMNVIQ